MKNINLWLLLCLATFTCGLKAQNFYSFSKSTQNSYIELTGDSLVKAFDATTGVFEIPALLGEKFMFYDTVFTIGTKGTIYLGKSPFIGIENPYSLVVIDGAFAKLDSIDQTTKISYKYEGTAGNHILKVQYKNFKLRNGHPGNSFSLQFWIHQKTGLIELRYGPRSANNASGYTATGGPHIGMFFSPVALTSLYQKLWCTGSPNNVVLDSTATLAFSAMSGLPDSGTIFRFTPRLKQTLALLNHPKKNTGLKLIPNPANYSLLVVTNQKGRYKLSVTDSYGRLVKTLVNPPETFEMDISDLGAGIYYLVLFTDDGKAFTEKLWVK